MDIGCPDIVGMRVSTVLSCFKLNAFANISTRIVEYATRDQAQNAVNTLSNQSLMGRLVYVREVCVRRIHGVAIYKY